jgi:hypothetical protein
MHNGASTSAPLLYRRLSTRLTLRTLSKQIYPSHPALQPVYRRTAPRYLSNQRSTFLQTMRPLRFPRTDRLGSIHRDLAQRSTSVSANTATQKGITIPQRIAVNHSQLNQLHPIKHSYLPINTVEFLTTPTLYVRKLFCYVSVAH